MKIKYQRTFNLKKKKVIVIYQGQKQYVGDIRKISDWQFYPADHPLDKTTAERIEKEVDLMNAKIHQQLLHSPLRATIFQSKINNQ